MKTLNLLLNEKLTKAYYELEERGFTLAASSLCKGEVFTLTMIHPCGLSIVVDADGIADATLPYQDWITIFDRVHEL